LKNKDIGIRLDTFLKQRFGDERGWLKNAAAGLSLAPSNLKKYLAGEYSPGTIIQDRLRELGCDIEWLMTGNKRKDELQSIDISLAQIPVYEYIKAGGKSMMLKEEPVEYVYTTKSADQSRYGVRVKGDSMQPEIKEGEIVVASKIAEVKNGDICVVTFHDGETCLRRVYFSDHSCTLTSDNTKIPPKIFKKKDVQFIHRVVEKITKY
jgi:phage repressor protein C with HTH and peptisase S24 domain